MTEFIPWGKTARYFRDIVVTEKIDGSNAAIQIIKVDNSDVIAWPGKTYVTNDLGTFQLVAQSRKRIITPADDNYGFARWVWKNAESLITDLGTGVHFGEWWGQGIQSKYGMDQKVFSLFNTSKWADADFVTDGLDVVPVLYEGPHSQTDIDEVLRRLRDYGSVASQVWGVAPEQEAEGVCIFHSASRTIYKITLLNDESPKGAVK